MEGTWRRNLLGCCLGFLVAICFLSYRPDLLKGLSAGVKSLALVQTLSNVSGLLSANSLQHAGQELPKDVNVMLNSTATASASEQRAPDMNIFLPVAHADTTTTRQPETSVVVASLPRQHSSHATKTLRQHSSLRPSVVPKGCAVRQESLSVRIAGGKPKSCTAAEKEQADLEPHKHMPCWTYGLWVECDANKLTFPYTRNSCLKQHPGIAGFNSMLRSQPQFNPMKNGRNPKIVLWQPRWPGPATGRCTDPLSSSNLDTGPWIMPDENELISVLKSRNIYYFGDSIAGQQSLAAAFMILCGARKSKNGNLLKYVWEGRSLVFPAIGAKIVHHGGGHFLGFQSRSVHKEDGSNYYINDAGEKVHIRGHGHKYYTDMAFEYPRPLVKVVTQQNVTLVINAGRWFKNIRGDSFFYNNGSQIQKPNMTEIFTELVRKSVRYYEAHLQSGSYVIWMGSNGAWRPIKRAHPAYCGSEMEPMSKPIFNAIQELKPKRNFFVDFGCAGSSPGPVRRAGDDIHWALPGAPDVMNLFVFRYMKELKKVLPSLG